MQDEEVADKVRLTNEDSASETLGHAYSRDSRSGTGSCLLFFLRFEVLGKSETALRVLQTLRLGVCPLEQYVLLICSFSPQLRDSFFRVPTLLALLLKAIFDSRYE